jgi:hypothetical protein
MAAVLVRAEAADSGGQQNDLVLRGDDEVVRGRRKESVANSRVRAAMQAALDKLRPKTVPAAVSAEMLQKERESVAARGRIVPKTAGKIATDEHTWEIYVTEQGLQIDEYPKVEQTVEFAIWMTHRRERACLAQREGSGPRLTGLVKRTIRNMLTELFTHSWPRLWPAYAALDKRERAAYEVAVLKQVDGLHKHRRH